MFDTGDGDNFGGGDDGDQPYGIRDILSARDVEIMAWHYADGRSYAEIAVLLQITKQSVHERVVRASRLLASHGYPVPAHPKPKPRPRHPDTLDITFGDIEKIAPRSPQRSVRIETLRKRCGQDPD